MTICCHVTIQEQRQNKVKIISVFQSKRESLFIYLLHIYYEILHFLKEDCRGGYVVVFASFFFF